MHLFPLIGSLIDEISRWYLSLIGFSIEEGLCWAHSLRRVFLFSSSFFLDSPGNG
jgi:hypothetical protein